MASALAMLGGMLGLIYYFASSSAPNTAEVVGGTLLVVFFVLAVAAGVMIWFLVLAHDSRLVAEEESSRQNTLLLKEIDAHGKTDAALQRAKEKAEAANLAKSRYVVGLSHELRTPLNAVMGYAQILERDVNVPENRRGSAQVIRRSAEHLSGLIDGLLDISKIEAGRLQVYSNEIHIQDFLDQIVDMFRLQAEAKGLEFRHHRAESLPVYVRTDEKRLRQVLVNLLSNAIKFTSAGHVRFDVDYRMQVATFTVEDSGSGISTDDLPHIFEPFVRGEAEKNRFTPGLGLGLTITKLLTETLGGEITVASEAGVGTTFKARLMLAKVERPSRRLAPARQIVGYQGARRTILVVDDNADHRELMREMLSPLGFAVLDAPDGATCLTLFDAVAPDLCFVDIRMPGMSGWDLVRALRERGVLVPLVMLSANIGDGANPTAADAGHSDTLAKPVDLGQLIDKLEVHLGLEWTEAERTAPAGEGGPLRSPGDEALRELASLGQIGHVRGIDTKLTELALDPVNGPLVSALRRHMQDYDFEGFAETLERVRHEPD